MLISDFYEKINITNEFDSICYYIVNFEKQKLNQPPVSWTIFCLNNF